MIVAVISAFKFGDPVVRQILSSLLSWWNAPKSVRAGVDDVLDAGVLLTHRKQYADATDAVKLTIRPVAKAEADALFDKWFPVATGS